MIVTGAIFIIRHAVGRASPRPRQGPISPAACGARPKRSARATSTSRVRSPQQVPAYKAAAAGRRLGPALFQARVHLVRLGLRLPAALPMLIVSLKDNNPFT
jgi:hypothetical protein